MSEHATRIKDRITGWPDWWGVFLGGLFLPVISFFLWLLFAGFFPGVEAASHIDDITAHTNIFGNALFLFIFAFPRQAFWGACLGWASQQVVLAWLERPHEVRFHALASGIIGTGYFGRFLWADWPVLFHERATSPGFAVAVNDAVIVACPLMWSLALLFLGICFRGR